MSRGWAVFWSLLALVAVPGGIYVGVNVYMLMKVCVSLSGYKLKGIDKDGNILLEFGLKVKNPSQLAVDIYGYSIDVDLNGNFGANAKSDKHKKLVANETSVLMINVKIDPVKTFGALKSKEVVGSFLTGQFDKIVVNLKGNFVGKLLGVKINMPVDFKYSLKEILDIMKTPSTPC